jgi:hypothetical protein
VEWVDENNGRRFPVWVGAGGASEKWPKQEKRKIIEWKKEK